MLCLRSKLMLDFYEASCYERKRLIFPSLAESTLV
jgi:hypothetical protein